jgi:hypothetical protein
MSICTGNKSNAMLMVRHTRDKSVVDRVVVEVRRVSGGNGRWVCLLMSCNNNLTVTIKMSNLSPMCSEKEG